MLLTPSVIRLFLWLFLLLSLITMAMLPLGPDEAYYWYWAKHPDLSYLDHPPLVAWIIALTTYICGDQDFYVRLGGFLLLWLGMGCGFATIRQLFPQAPKALAWEYLLVLNLTLLIPGATMIQTPDTPLFASWMLALYFGAKIVTAQDKFAWYGLGIAVGLGLLSKYTMVLLVPGILSFLLLSPSHRYWLRRPEPWLGALLALLIWTPVLIWNGQHNWISFRFQLTQGFEADPTPKLERLGNYIGGQAAVISPVLWLAFVWYSLRGIRTDIRDPVCLYLTLTSWPIILFFAWTSLRGTTAEANWPGPAYFSGLMLAWVVLRGQLGSHLGNRQIAFTVIAISLGLNLAARTHLLHPWLPLPLQKDRVSDFASWPTLGQQICAAIDAHPHAKGWFLLGDKGTTLAEALHYSNRNLIGFDPAHPERYLFLTDLNRQLRGKNAIIITQAQPATITHFNHLFHHLTLLEPYKHKYRGAIIHRHSNYLYLGENFVGN